jgi:hypothetical protein
MLNIAVEIRKAFFRDHRATHFFATVDVFAAGPPPTATIIRNGQTVADTEAYVVADEVAALSPGDVVIVLDVTGEGGLVVTHLMP